MYIILNERMSKTRIIHENIQAKWHMQCLGIALLQEHVLLYVYSKYKKCL